MRCASSAHRIRQRSMTEFELLRLAAAVPRPECGVDTAIGSLRLLGPRTDRGIFGNVGHVNCMFYSPKFRELSMWILRPSYQSVLSKKLRLQFVGFVTSGGDQIT